MYQRICWKHWLRSMKFLRETFHVLLPAPLKESHLPLSLHLSGLLKHKITTEHSEANLHLALRLVLHHIATL